jgi:hypothetical protein
LNPDGTAAVTFADNGNGKVCGSAMGMMFLGWRKIQNASRQIEFISESHFL